jgi:hypothetical protein
MGSAIRCFAVATAMVVLVPAVSFADADVERDDGTGIIMIVGDAAADDISVARDATSDTISRVGGNLLLQGTSTGCTGGGAVAINCPRGSSLSVDLGGGADRFRASTVNAPISVAGGDGPDDLSTGTGADVLAGGGEGDTLDGLGGVDQFFGETGDDVIEARDGNAERISCGAGADEARNDFTDIIAECERGVDADADGFSSAVDCNDGARAVFPGAQEVFDNGVDENCDGRDNPNLDLDRDGFPRPFDCDDGNSAIRPTVPEIRGNAADENCDRRAEPFADLGSVVSNQWVFGPRFSRLRTLVVHTAPAGARVTFRCSGRSCPTRRTRRVRVRSVLSRVVLHRPFRRARLRPGTRLRVTITAAETIGRTYTYVVKRGAAPETRIVCRPPGARRGRSC